MRSSVKLSSILVVGLLVGALLNQMLYDADLDGIPNAEDAFPRDSSESVSYTHLTLPTNREV